MILSQEEPRVTLGQWYKAVNGDELPIGKSFMVVLEEFADEDLDEVKKIESNNIKAWEHNQNIEDDKEKLEFMPFPERRIVVSWGGIIPSEDVEKIVSGESTTLGAVTTRTYIIENCIRDIEHVMEVNREGE